MSFKCNKCNQLFANNSNFHQHILSVHKKERRFIRNDCDYSTFNNWSLEKHVGSLHKQEKHFTSNECDYATSYNSELKKHILSVHRQEMPFICKQCDHSFLKTVSLQGIHKQCIKMKNASNAMHAIYCFVKRILSDNI